MLCTGWREHRGRRYGFAWSTSVEEAREFAESPCGAGARGSRGWAGGRRWRAAGDRSSAPAEAILHVRDRELRFYGADGQPAFEES